MKVKPKLQAGIRLNQSASQIIQTWSKLTGQSANWVTSWAVNAIRDALTNPGTIETQRAEMEALRRVQDELMLSRQRITIVKQRLQSVRASKNKSTAK